jgi:hypothetical protein
MSGRQRLGAEDDVCDGQLARPGVPAYRNQWCRRLRNTVGYTDKYVDIDGDTHCNVDRNWHCNTDTDSDCNAHPDGDADRDACRNIGTVRFDHV